MNNEETNKAYPCDLPDNSKRYPCDIEGEAFSYGKAETSYASSQSAADLTDDSDAPLRKGKGRRGGNASASIVVHSGKTPARRSSKEDGDNFSRIPGRGSRRGERFDNRSFESDNRRGGRFDNQGFESDSRHGNRKDFNRSDRRTGGRFEHDEKRGGRQYSRGNDRNSNRPLSPESVFSHAYTTKIVKTTEVGAFVAAPKELHDSCYSQKLPDSGLVLLPFAEQLGRPQSGTEVRVFFYEDKGGRLAATMRSPILKDGEIGILTVAASTRIGVFLDNGVPKQILLPFKEQLHTPEIGDEVLVWLYQDKSGRQAATMRVYAHLEKHSPYKEDDRVTGFVYEVNPKLGIFVAVDNKYYGLVPINETFKEYSYGDEIEARVASVREDGKLNLLIRDKLYKTVQEDADVILYELKRNNGFLPYGDRADAAFIEETYAMSKNQFKRALGHLYKKRIVELDREADTVRLL